MVPLLSSRGQATAVASLHNNHVLFHSLRQSALLSASETSYNNEAPQASSVSSCLKDSLSIAGTYYSCNDVFSFSSISPPPYLHSLHLVLSCQSALPSCWAELSLSIPPPQHHEGRGVPCPPWPPRACYCSHFSTVSNHVYRNGTFLPPRTKRLWRLWKK
jgi:hypothetical protein